jgi:hypothetical protein
MKALVSRQRGYAVRHSNGPRDRWPPIHDFIQRNLRLCPLLNAGRIGNIIVAFEGLRADAPKLGCRLRVGLVTHDHILFD